MTGPAFQGWTNTQYAYMSLDNLLSDIIWDGIKYSYLKSSNVYEKSTEYDNTPSHINGISQGEYEDIKEGKYPNVHITEDDTTNGESNTDNQDTDEQLTTEKNTEDNTIVENTSPVEEYLEEQEGVLVKTYNTIKIESDTGYHIIEIYKHKDNKFSYQVYWYIYNDKIPTRSSSERFNTIDEALNDMINHSEMKMSISDLTEQ